VLQLLGTADFVRITPDPDGEDAAVEVKHESLVRNWPELVTWIGEKRDRYRQRLGLTDAAANWKRLGKPADDGLLTGSLLADAAKQADLSELEREYVRASEDAADKAQRELKQTNEMLASRYRAAKYALITAGALFIIVCLTVGIAIWQYYKLTKATLTAMQQNDQLKEARLTVRNFQAARLSDVQVDLLNGV